uniref:Putative bovine pancreatic trypsin inhibitor n=1 Tax=Rhipicephalus microplus TaxID=6941 RepID=A0A6G5A2V8_RHIMP
MALLCCALAFLTTIAYGYAAPQTQPGFCLERPIKAGCREMKELWYIDPRTKTCIPQRHVLCGGGQGFFHSRQACFQCQRNLGKKGPQACPPNPFLGGCQPTAHKWYYDHDYKTCRPFQGGECSRGLNHFPTEYRCRETCVPGVVKPPDRCQKPVVRGRCKDLYRFWRFDFQRNDCVKYRTGLCGVGDNTFVTKESCLSACKRPLGQKAPGCLNQPLYGSCHSTKLAWFFDNKVGRCKMFRQGECGVGGNYFASEVKCMQECLRIGNPEPVCSAKPVSAYCMGYGTYWYFDQTKTTAIVSVVAGVEKMQMDLSPIFSAWIIAAIQMQETSLCNLKTTIHTLCSSCSSK